MNELTLLRVFVLVLGVLALLTATVLDGVTMRFVMQPFVRHIDELSGGRAKYPPAMQFMLEHAWARRLYHALFAAIMIGLWWFLGTPAGTAILRPGH